MRFWPSGPLNLFLHASTSALTFKFYGTHTDSFKIGYWLRPLHFIWICSPTSAVGSYTRSIWSSDPLGFGVCFWTPEHLRSDSNSIEVKLIAQNLLLVETFASLLHSAAFTSAVGSYDIYLGLMRLLVKVEQTGPFRDLSVRPSLAQVIVKCMPPCWVANSEPHVPVGRSVVLILT